MSARDATGPNAFSDREAIAAMIRDGRRNGVDDLDVAEEILALLWGGRWADNPALAKAMAHPVRVKILRLLRDGPVSPSRAVEQLADPKVTLGTISYHFRALAELGLVEIHSTRPRRGALEHIYALSEAQNSVDPGPASD